MKRLLLMAGVLLATPTAAIAAGAPKPDPSPVMPVRGGHECVSQLGRGVLFTVKMGERAGRAVYRGTRRVRSSERAMLRRIERCQRNPQATPFVRHFDAARRAAHAARVEAARVAAEHPWHSAVATYYYDAGSTGCGFHATYGIATDIIPCGGHVELRGPGGATVTATRDDSPGPGVAANGATFDLNVATRDAIGCSDMCDLSYR
jgi:hypothetical protein